MNCAKGVALAVKRILIMVGLTGCMTMLLVTGCAQKKVARPDMAAPMSFEVAARMVAFDLFAQVKNGPAKARKSLLEKINEMPINGNKPSPLLFATDMVINADTGEEIELSGKLNGIIKTTAENSFPGYVVVEMDSTNVDKADVVITGVIRLQQYNNQTKKLPHFFLSAVDLRSSQVVAHSEVWFADQDLVLKPTPLYADSPMFIKDNRSAQIIATVSANTGSPADNEYFSSLATNALLAEAGKAYDNGDYTAAVDLFNKVAEKPDGKVMKTFAGLYQAYLKLNQTDKAEEAFGTLAELGIANKALSVKFLFKINDTSFFGQPEELTEYAIWLRQMAGKIIESNTCVEISGHASHSGSAEYNKRLSSRRAQTIQQQLKAVAPEIAKKTSAVGRGFEQNIVGIGTDDVRDAIDRRVEFRVVDCQSLGL